MMEKPTQGVVVGVIRTRRGKNGKGRRLKGLEADRIQAKEST